MIRAAYERPMPDQGHPRSAHRSVSRIPRFFTVLLWICAGCGTSVDPSLDSGVADPVPKEAGATSEDSGGPVFDDAAAAPDAAQPDAAPLADRDHDGIPDSEDPAPDTVNRVLFSDDFSSSDPKWLITSAAMSATRGAMRVDVTDGIVREGWLGPQPGWTDILASARVKITRHGRVDDLGAGRAAVTLHVLQVVPNRYLSCGIDSRRGMAYIAEHDGGNSAGRVLVEQMLPGALGQAHDVTFGVEGTRYICTVSGIRLQVTNSLYSSGSVGLRSHDVVFEVDQLTVFAL